LVFSSHCFCHKIDEDGNRISASSKLLQRIVDDVQQNHINIVTMMENLRKLKAHNCIRHQGIKAPFEDMVGKSPVLARKTNTIANHGTRSAT
jgi:hypothetical protein